MLLKRNFLYQKTTCKWGGGSHKYNDIFIYTQIKKKDMHRNKTVGLFTKTK